MYQTGKSSPQHQKHAILKANLNNESKFFMQPNRTKLFKSLGTAGLLFCLLIPFQNCGKLSAISTHLLDSSSTAPTPQVFLPAPNAEPTTSWFGNSFGKAPQVMPLDVESLFVDPTGHVFSNAYWSETGNQSGIFKEGSSLAFMEGLQGWGRTGGYAVAASDNFVFIAMTQSGCDGGNDLLNSNGVRQYPPCGTAWIAIRRYDRSGHAAPFAGGVGYDGSMKIINSLSTNDGHVIQPAIPRGMHVLGTNLYVADPVSNQILIYSISDLSAVSSFNVTSPLSITHDANNFLWIGQTDGSIRQYTVLGALTGLSVHVPNLVGLAVDLQNRLLVADGGPDQNIKIVTGLTATPTVTGSIGEVGGVGGGSLPGALGDLKFNGLVGVGADNSGNIYVAQNGKGVARDAGFNFNVEIKSLSPNLSVNWHLFTNEYVNGGVFDPLGDGQSVYTTFMHYTSSVADSATFSRFGFPDDPRNHIGRGFLHPIALRWINGKKFLFMSGMFPAGLFIFKFDGELATPSGILSSSLISDSNSQPWPVNQPTANNGAWIWRDQNGDSSQNSNEYEAGDSGGNDRYGWWVDLNGDVWQGTQDGVRRYQIQSLDPNGNPIYHLANSTLFPLPANLTWIGRLIHQEATDTVFITGYQGSETDDGCWGTLGKTLVRLDHFTTNPTIAWQTKMPFNCSTGEAPKAMDIAGQALFTAESTDGGSGGGYVRVYDIATGIQTVQFYPGSAVGGSNGVSWTDIPYALHAFERRNGQYLLLNEDDLFGKILSYSW